MSPLGDLLVDAPRHAAARLEQSRRQRIDRVPQVETGDPANVVQIEWVRSQAVAFPRQPPPGAHELRRRSLVVENEQNETVRAVDGLDAGQRALELRRVGALEIVEDDVRGPAARQRGCGGLRRLSRRREAHVRDRRTVLGSRLCALRRQTGLPDPGRAGDRHDGPLAAPREAPRPAQPPDVEIAADDRRDRVEPGRKLRRPGDGGRGPVGLEAQRQRVRVDSRGRHRKARTGSARPFSSTSPCSCRSTPSRARARCVTPWLARISPARACEQSRAARFNAPPRYPPSTGTASPASMPMPTRSGSDGSSSNSSASTSCRSTAARSASRAETKVASASSPRSRSPLRRELPPLRARSPRTWRRESPQPRLRETA